MGLVTTGTRHPVVVPVVAVVGLTISYSWCHDVVKW